MAKHILQGRLSRLAKLAGLGARTGASLLFNRDERTTVAANKAAEVLGDLRGLATKIGQMASYVDGMIPDAYRDTYTTALRQLQSAAPTSSPEAIQERLEIELGAPLEQLFAEFDKQPIASASIGQVHRARLFDGSEVAVKVQHPGVEQAVKSDLNNAAMLQKLIAVVGPSHMDSESILAEVKARFLEELDYTLEAKRQQFFRDLHQDDPSMDIPQVIENRSSQRVLTSLFKTGKRLEEILDVDTTLRTRYAETLWRFVFKGNLVGGMFNADPHPGNYLFREDASIVFLDFGCVQPITGDHLAGARLAHQAAINRDEVRFREAIIGILHTNGGLYEDTVLHYIRQCFEPIFNSPFCIDSPYVKSLTGMISDMKKILLNKNSGYVQPQEGLVFMNRMQFGFYSVLAKLNVRVDYAAVEQPFMDQFIRL